MRRVAATVRDGTSGEGIDVIVLDIYSHPLGNRHAPCYVSYPRKAMNIAFLMASPTYKESRC